jgi:hypothetical protein
MKKVFLFLASALVCGIMMTSCGKDDDGGSKLNSLRVEPSTITLPVGETQQVTVTKIPVDAPDPTYKWETSDDKVATVSATGLVTITGIGTATVTVSDGGSIKATVAVTGTVKSVAVKDAAGGNIGSFDETAVGTSFTLTVTVDPANTGVKPEWSVDVATVTVTPSADGLSAQVTIVDAGTAVVTADVGGVTSSYTITTTSILETAVGYWTFDDPNNLLAATIGEDLVLGAYPSATDEITAVAGPAAGNGAAVIPLLRWLKCYHGISGNGPIDLKEDGTPDTQLVNEFTLMFDVMTETDNYNALFQCYPSYPDQTDEASMYLKSGGRIGTGDISNSQNDLWQLGKWFRVVFSVKAANDGEGGFYNYYVNGELAKEHPAGSFLANHHRHMIHPAPAYVSFFHDSKGDPTVDEAGDGYDRRGPISVAAIAIWDHPLTTAEIAALGMFEIE